ncbi:MAG: mRNA surveillance protein pelota [Candidatus ainarchaeum sp.]|nr:mRNA surveillance protein pelota [Candidatus ainarchaeum sp.]
MKIIKIDKKLNEIIVLPETIDDLWHLEKIIQKDDIILGKTDRKIKPSKEGEKVIRQVIFVKLLVENIHFQEFSENLKISGIILDGKPKEFIELKAHQSIDIKISEKLKIIKKEIQKWQIERLKKAEEESATSEMLTIILDDESAELAFINQYSINKKALIRTKKQGKMFEEQKSNFFEEILKKILMINPKKIFIVGPGFTKDNLKKFILEKRKYTGKIITETINSIGETGLRELITSGKLSNIEKELQLTKESKLIEEFLEKLSKNKAEYGIEKIKDELNNGIIEKIIISETYLLQNRDETEKIMDLAEKFGGEINIISSKNPQETTIYNMGGIVAILRYRKQEI